MILASVAPRYTFVNTGQTTASIAGGETIKVHGVVGSSAAGGGSITLFENDGTTTIAILQIPGGVTVEIKTGFLAVRGLKVTTSANCTCTVFHTNGSA